MGIWRPVACASAIAAGAVIACTLAFVAGAAGGGADAPLARCAPRGKDDPAHPLPGRGLTALPVAALAARDDGATAAPAGLPDTARLVPAITLDQAMPFLNLTSAFAVAKADGAIPALSEESRLPGAARPARELPLLLVADCARRLRSARRSLFG
jgi:hypothetical protein